MEQVRVRFAPSPTGVLHIGGLRTALYNYLFAKQNGGQFILRIEDTDQTRFVEGAEDYIHSALKWCGLHWDEGPHMDGPYGPYRQSERKEIYAQYVQKMIDEGNAYYAFDTPEELESMRNRLKEAKANSLSYNSISRQNMKNSLTLPSEEVEKRITSGEPFVIRVKMPAKEDIRLKDLVRGWVNVHSSTLDDKVLMKSDGLPTYHLANVVDDHLMKISHVIRGEEWLPSAPLHVMLYRFLGWEDTIPQFAHLPLIMKPEGNGKLSKRDAAKHGFPIFPLSWYGEGEDSDLKGFKEEGYLPEAFVNFLALLGWNPGTEDELFSLDELIENFSIDRINKAGAKFDIQKAIWFNQQYIRKLSVDDLSAQLLFLAQESDIKCDKERAKVIAGLLQERIDFTVDLLNKGRYFFADPQSYPEKVVRKKWKEPAQKFLPDFANAISESTEANTQSYQEVFEQALARNEVNAGSVMQILRIAVTGEAGGPDLMPIMSSLGTRIVIDRINKAISTFDQITHGAEKAES